LIGLDEGSQLSGLQRIVENDAITKLAYEQADVSPDDASDEPADDTPTPDAQ